MTEVAEKVIREALGLDPVERVAVIEELLSSLDNGGPLCGVEPEGFANYLFGNLGHGYCSNLFSQVYATVLVKPHT